MSEARTKTRPAVLGLVTALCLCASTASAATLLPQIPAAATALVVAPTNKPVTVYFDAWPTNQQYYTSLTSTNTINLGTTVKSNGNYLIFSNATMTVKVWESIPVYRMTNNMVTVTPGTNRNVALTNWIQSVVTNRGPVTLWLAPTSSYTIALWVLPQVGGRELLQFRQWPESPSNQVRLVWNLLFSDRIERPTHQWVHGGQSYSFTLTNGASVGTNKFVRAVGSAIIDDFTPKAVIFDQCTFGIFTNSP